MGYCRNKFVHLVSQASVLRYGCLVDIFSYYNTPMFRECYSVNKVIWHAEGNQWLWQEIFSYSDMPSFWRFAPLLIKKKNYSATWDYFLFMLKFWRTFYCCYFSCSFCVCVFEKHGGWVRSKHGTWHTQRMHEYYRKLQFLWWIFKCQQCIHEHLVLLIT